MNVTNVQYCTNPTSVGVNTMIIMNPFKPNAIPARSRYTGYINYNYGKPTSSPNSSATATWTLMDDPSISRGDSQYPYYFNGSYAMSSAPGYGYSSSAYGCPCYFFSI
jgi:hypothetical protein